MNGKPLRTALLFAIVAFAAVSLGGIVLLQVVGSALRDAGVSPEASSSVQRSVLAALAALGVILLGVAFVAGRAYGRSLTAIREIVLARARGDMRPPPAFAVRELGSLMSAVERLSAYVSAREARTAHEGAQVAFLLDAISEGILQLDAAGRVVRANPAARRMIGLPPSPVGQPVTAGVRHAELRRVLARAVQGSAIPAAEVALDDRRIIVSAHPLSTGGGTVVALVDLTEVRRLESVRRDFVANVSHELKTPLTSIRGYAETLLGDDDMPAAMRREFIEIVHRNATRLHDIVDELLDLQLMLARARHLARHGPRGTQFKVHKTLTSELRAALPWDLTADQRKAVREIFSDMTADQRMHRLLMGDVGTGKTVVALFAMLLALENGYQAALMAPTELLVEQHHATLTSLLAPLGIVPDLLLGRLNAQEKLKVRQRLTGGEARLVVGTHALLQEQVTFKRLGLVVIDEQHRFGVEQRGALMAKGEAPDVLLLTATPIPRSLALTRYGDLDMSVLRERPPGRGTIRTAVRTPRGREKVFEFVRQSALEGRQVYVVLPVIDESGKVAGILHESDLLLAVVKDKNRFRDTVSSAMSSNLETIQADQPMEALLPIFDRGYVAIVMDDEEFLGLITRIDLINNLRRKLK